MGIEKRWTLLFLTLAKALPYGGDDNNEECCEFKEVGGFRYTKVSNGNVPDVCNTDCIYEREDIPGSRYCFAKGSLEVHCLDGEKVSGYEISWLTNTTMSIKFPDNSSDKIVLTKDNEEPGSDSGTPCLYTGILEGDLNSSVLVVGCWGDQNTTINIISDKIPTGIIDLLLSDGKASIILTSMDTYLNRTNEDYGHGEFPNKTEKQEKYYTGPLPPYVILDFKLKYDDSLRYYFHNDDNLAKYWLHVIYLYARHYLRRLDIQVRLKRDSYIEHIGETITYNQGNPQPAFDKLNNMFKNERTLFSVLIHNNGLGEGVATIGSACSSSYKFSFLDIKANSNGVSYVKSGKVLAHEIAHNLGVYHDFHPINDGNGKPNGWYGCNVPPFHIMSYQPTDGTWSDCSNRNFISFYRGYGWCLKTPGW